MGSDADDSKEEQETQAVEPEEDASSSHFPEEPLLALSKVAIMDLVSKWTMESGVRSLERRIAQICRWAALRLAGPGAAGADGQSEKELAAFAALADCGPDAA